MSLMGELKLFLGFQISQSTSGICLTQSKYAKEVLKEFEMDSAKAIDTPMCSTTKLDNFESEKSVDQTLYRGIIRSLLYLSASRPDIMYSVGVCARFQANPKLSNLSAVKRILRYIKGSIDLGLFYPSGTKFNLMSYSDADFGG